MRSTLGETQDRILRGFANESKGASASAGSAVATSLVMGEKHKNYFEKEEAPEYSFASAEYFKAYCAEKAEKEALAKASKKKK